MCTDRVSQVGKVRGCNVRLTPRCRARGEEVVIVGSEHERRLDEYERQVDDLQAQVKALEEEVVVLRRRLQDAPKRVRTLEERLLETKGQLAQAVSQNEKLSATLRPVSPMMATAIRCDAYGTNPPA